MMLTTYFQASHFSMTWGLLENVGKCVESPKSWWFDPQQLSSPHNLGGFVGSVGFVPGDAWGFRGADEHLRPEVETLRLWVRKQPQPEVPSGELAMENHHAINGKIHYFYGHFPLLFVCSPEGI